MSLSEQLTLPLLNKNLSLKLTLSFRSVKTIFDLSHLLPSSEKQLIFSKFFCLSKNSIIALGGFLFCKIYLSSGVIFLDSSGYKFIKKCSI